MDGEVLTYEKSPTASEQRLKYKGVLGTSFSDNYFETINVITLSHKARHTSVHDNLDAALNESD